MRNFNRQWLTLPAALLLGALLGAPIPSYGQQVKLGDVLPAYAAGGKTIAGPGIFVGVDNLDHLQAQFPGVGVVACTTVTNFSPGSMRVKHDLVGAGTSDIILDPQSTRTHCADSGFPFENLKLIESRIIFCQSRQREDCFQKAVIKRGLRRIRRKALRARWSSSQ